MKHTSIDNGQEFDFGETSLDYSKYRDIYPDSMFSYLYNNGIGKKGQNILDLGTGTGVFPRSMYKYGAKYIGIDISKEQIEQAKKISKEQNMNIKYKVCSAESTKQKTNVFDVITAVQCFVYFDKTKVLPEIKRMLKTNGKFVTIWMTWLPHEDKIADETEKLVLKYNPKWTGYGYKRKKDNKKSEWFRDYFELEKTIEYLEQIEFTYETWAGRIRACRGVSASLPENVVNDLNEEHIKRLKELTQEPFRILHEIQIGIFKIKAKNCA